MRKTNITLIPKAPFSGRFVFYGTGCQVWNLRLSSFIMCRALKMQVTAIAAIPSESVTADIIGSAWRSVTITMRKGSALNRPIEIMLRRYLSGCL